MYKLLFGAQAFVWIAGLGMRSEWLPEWLRRPHGVLRTFALFQVAAATAFWKFLRNDYDVWRPGTTLMQTVPVVAEPGSEGHGLKVAAPESIAKEAAEPDRKRAQS
jgi:hypothetical protein